LRMGQASDFRLGLRPERPKLDRGPYRDGVLGRGS